MPGLATMSVNAGTNAYDPLSGQAGYGNDKGIQMKNKGYIQVYHKAKFANICCDSCDLDKERKFLYITEHSIMANYPEAFNCFCFTLPPNACCPGSDHITWSFYDRGIFDRQSCLWKFGCLSGKPVMFDNEIKYVCCFMDCCDCYNKYMSCWWFNCCGERVRFLPCETFCCCCPTRSCWLQNCFGLCGPKSGEPFACCLVPMAVHLGEGEGPKFVESYKTAQSNWVQFSGKTEYA